MPSIKKKIENLQQNGPVIEVRLALSSILEEGLRREKQSIPTPVAGLAMLDTGASRTVIRNDIPQKLALNPVGFEQITTPFSESVPCPLYSVRILFPNRVTVETTAIAAPLKGQPIICLIGRDALRVGIFIYNGPAETFTLSF